MKTLSDYMSQSASLVIRNNVNIGSVLCCLSHYLTYSGEISRRKWLRKAFALQTALIKAALTAALTMIFFILLWFTPVYAADAAALSLDIRVETDTASPVMPRENVNYKLYVDNLGAEAWLRIHTSTYAENLNRSFGNEYIHNADGWVRRGSYIYFTRKADAASSILAIDGFTVPDTNMSRNATLKLSVRAEAIDTRAVTPDFTTDDPWKGHTTDTVRTLNDTNSYTADKSSVSTVRTQAGNTNRSSSGSSGGSSSNASDALIRYNAPIANALSSSGRWTLADAEHKLWQYIAEGGRLAKDGWYYIYNSYSGEGGKTEWFYFDNSGYMQTGWTVMNSTDWYHLHELSDGSLGALTTGWYTDTQDSKTYYLNNTTGLMQSGWQTIGNKAYYFTPLSEIPGPNWVYTLISGTAFGRWLYGSLNARSYGSMYINETTPDGSRVDASGAKIS